MSQIPVGVDRQLWKQAVRPKSLAAPTVQRFSDASRNTVRFWEWDCSAKYPIISRLRYNSSQFDTFRQSCCNFYTQSQPFVYRNQSRQCPILGDNPTEFIIIQHNPTHFERPRGAGFQADVFILRSTTMKGKENPCPTAM